MRSGDPSRTAGGRDGFDPPGELDHRKIRELLSLLDDAAGLGVQDAVEALEYGRLIHVVRTEDGDDRARVDREREYREDRAVPVQEWSSSTDRITAGVFWTQFEKNSVTLGEVPGGRAGGV